MENYKQNQPGQATSESGQEDVTREGIDQNEEGGNDGQTQGSVGENVIRNEGNERTNPDSENSESHPVINEDLNHPEKEEDDLENGAVEIPDPEEIGDGEDDIEPDLETGDDEDRDDRTAEK
ncbi:hypothetical protein TH53_09320 [Pedobacter lusitanus]|uniref:Uncharacterized protein n=1 Tax=Pedobacter lusitanus TaxID=1503925 RepID=A0A0D0FY46_9SPHI|nr:hypothetical protein [Pedobacter lusitanus]KIO77464.1 hypothetical protein TH53_09320 [Pedobacter lusitanus]